MSFFQNIFSNFNNNPQEVWKNMSPDEKMSWLASPKGQTFLSRRPQLQQMYVDGRLEQILRNPQQSEELNQLLSAVGKGGRGGRGRGGGRGQGRGGRGRGQHNGKGGIEYFPTLCTISDEDRFNILCDGYTVLPSIIPEKLCREAKKFINYQIGNPTEVATENIPRAARLTSYHSSNPSLLNLLYATPLASLVDSLLHCNGIAGERTTDSVVSNVVVRGCQIAIRFPELQDVGVNEQLGGVQWHIDGMDKGDHSPFTLLVGVALSDQLDSFMGNLCVFPASHHEINQLCNRDATGHDNTISVIPNRPILKEPTQVLMRAGDVVLCHQKLAHRGGPNYSADIRLMVYFRISHRNHTELKGSALDNLWIEYEGIDNIS